MIVYNVVDNNLDCGMVNVKNQQDSRIKVITRSASKPKTLNHRTDFQGGSFCEIEIKVFGKH